MNLISCLCRLYSPATSRPDSQPGRLGAERLSLQPSTSSEILYGTIEADEGLFDLVLTVGRHLQSEFESVKSNTREKANRLAGSHTKPPHL